jgi:hypothetical protein
MSLKLILISPSGTLLKDSQLHPQLVTGVSGAIQRLHKLNVRTAIWSNRRWIDSQNKKPLEQFFSEQAGCQVEYIRAGTAGFPARRRAGSVAPVLAHFGVSPSETILVGNGDEDVMAGVNNQLLLVRPAWYPTVSEYGFKVTSIAELERFCTIFGLRAHPIYWSVNDAGVRAYAMGPYSTKIKEYAGFGADAFRAAKFEQGTLEFWHRLVVSSLYFSGLIFEVKYIASYPGHAQGTKVRAVDEVMTSLGKCFRKTFFPDLIERHTTAVKSAFAGSAQKTFVNQLNTIKLNPYPHPYGKDKPRKTAIGLQGKAVLIVDDICTNGRSMDCARAYVEAAGGEALSFAWLKTINSSYLRMNPDPALKPFQTNTIAQEPASQPYAYGDCIQDHDAPAEISVLLDKYKAWKV